jgi:hypothetical protein
MENIEAWIDLTFTRYVGSFNRRPADQLAEIRESLCAKADLYRASFHARAGRAWAAQHLDEVLGRLLTDEFDAGSMPPAKLFASIEAMKARTLLDQMAGRFSAPRAPATRAKLAGLEREVTRFAPSADHAPDTQLTFEEMRNVSRLPIGTLWDRGERRALLDKLEQAYCEFGGGFEGVEPIADLADVQRTLGPREMLIEYFIPFHPLHPAIGLIVLAITAGNCHVRRFDFARAARESGEFTGSIIIDGRQPLAVDELGSRVLLARTAIQNGDDDKARAQLRPLHDLVMWPLLTPGVMPKDLDHLILVPHGVLHVMPFAALVNAQARYLIEDLALSVVPSATVWHRLATTRRPALSGFLGLANPLPDTRPLQAAEPEVRRVAELLQPLTTAVLQREQATKPALRAHLPGNGILHFATHGEFPELDAIDFHRILLAPSPDDDGRLNADEIRGMDLHAIRLAVLSICNGGLYRFGPGDEPYGLMPMFLIAGAENVIGTLWPIEDEFGRIFMRRLYAEKLPAGPVHALQRTASYFIERDAKLRQWASCVLVGPGRPVA